MKVRFKREGGFAGMTMRQEAELDELPKAAQRALSTLRKLSSPQLIGSAIKRPDGFLYTFELETDTDPVVMSIEEQKVTKDIEPLIRYFEVR